MPSKTIADSGGRETPIVSKTTLLRMPVIQDKVSFCERKGGVLAKKEPTIKLVLS
ncbi:MAG: hypothetical protein LBK53_05400 [Heliobacteriaceae bacterium]|nr:hypothetical protein [Heliobacteriaceae bacterium]